MEDIKLDTKDLDIFKLLEEYNKQVVKKDFPVGFQAPKRDNDN